MRATPALLSTSIRNESFAGLTYHIEGDTVPVLHVELGRDPIYFEHHVLLWKNTQVDITLKALAGAFKRVVSGMSVFMTQAGGPGQIAFSRDGAGQLLALHLRRGEGVDIREHQFLAATDGVDYSFQRVKGIANMLFGGTGFFIDTFKCAAAEGIVWLHGYGNVFELTIEAGEQIDVEPGGWIYKDPTVRMETVAQSLSTGFFASAGMLAFNRFTGPGRLAIQSMYLHMPTED